MTSIRWRSDYALCALYPCNLSAYTAVHLVWPPLGHIAGIFLDQRGWFGKAHFILL